MRRVVVDPNVLVSAFISRRGGAPDVLVRAWQAGAFELIVSPALLAELTDVLGRAKFARQAGEGRAAAYLAAIATDALYVEDPPSVPAVSTDRDDDYLFALARAAGAAVIVSGDRHLSALPSSDPPVQTPRQFADELPSPP